MASKVQGGSGVGERNSSQQLLDALMEFCSGDEFQIMAEEFCLNNCHHFSEDEEHKLEYTFLHKDFQSLFESHVQRFIDERGINEKHFFRVLREAQASGEKNAEWIDIFLASSEYHAFVHLMRFMKQKMEALGDPRLQRQRQYEVQQVVPSEDDVEIVEGQGLAMLNSLMGKK
jgi:hypothetical protein